MPRTFHSQEMALHPNHDLQGFSFPSTGPSWIPGQDVRDLILNLAETMCICHKIQPAHEHGRVMVPHYHPAADLDDPGGTSLT